MESRDLSKLTIDSGKRETSSSLSRFRKRLFLVLASAVVAAVFAFAAWTGMIIPAKEISTGKVAPIFPSRALTQLNASGYVTAQKKAAVSSKITGKLEKLYVEEGMAVKEGDILAQLENKDLKASAEEADATIRVAKAALNNAEAELHDATLNYERNKSLRERRVSLHSGL